MKVQRWLQEIMEHQIEFKPELFLLGIIKGKCSKQIQYIILHIINSREDSFCAGLATRKHTLSEEMLIQKILDCVERDKLTIMELKGKEESKYYAVWDRWYKRIEHRSKD
uniref:Uncharacterized protein n=1 Tax=Micrurus paraensis TaxID=1970185 RepID=A0A2D4KBU2_9SAUR